MSTIKPPIEEPTEGMTPEGEKERKRWPLKTVIEVFPIFMALTALLTFGTARRAGQGEVLTPLSRMTDSLPLWSILLLAGCFAIGIFGIIWATWVFSRAPVAPDGSDDDQ